MRYVRDKVTKINARQIKSQVEKLLATALDPDDLANKVKSMAGINGTEVVGEMAHMHTVIDALPTSMVEALYTGFINDLYV